MQFILYTDKSVAQCLSAVNARMQVKPTPSKPGLDGWVQKNGSFMISAKSSVVARIERRTQLTARLERDGGITMVRGHVPSGAPPSTIALILAALSLVGVLLATSDSTVLALGLIPVAAILSITLKGDYANSEYLLDELMKTLRAKETPPKTSASSRKPTQTKSVTVKTVKPDIMKAPASTPKPAPAKPKIPAKPTV